MSEGPRAFGLPPTEAATEGEAERAPARALPTPLGEASGEAWPPGVLSIRKGPGANCSSAGSAIDVLFYSSLAVGAAAAALAAAFAPRPDDGEGGDEAPRASDDDATRAGDP